MLTAVAYLHPSSSIDPNSDKNGIHGSRNNNNNNIISANNNNREGGAQLGSVRLQPGPCNLRGKTFFIFKFPRKLLLALIASLLIAQTL